MSSQAEWRQIAYERSRGAQGYQGSTIYGQDAYNKIYVPQKETAQRARESMMRSVSTPAPRFDVGGSPALSRSDSSAGALADTGYRSPGASSGYSYPTRAPLPLPVRLAVLAVPLSGIAALVWSIAIQDVGPIATWWSGLVFCLRAAATALGLVISQVIALGIEAYVAARPMLDVAVGHISALSWPWALGVCAGGLIALILLLRGIRKIFQRMPKGWRIVSVVAVVASPTLFWGSSWWPVHQYLTRVIINWGQSNIGWMFLG